MAVACLHKKSNIHFGDNVNKVNKQKVSLEFHAYIVQHCTFVINLGDGQLLLNAEVLFVYYWETWNCIINEFVYEFHQSIEEPKYRGTLWKIQRI